MPNSIRNIASTSSDISTIFIIGFPDDFKERELHNLFLFASGFEGAVLKSINIPLVNSDDSQRKQLIGFVKFSKPSEALYGLEILNGRILDQERGLVLKAEIAKKNLFIKSSTCTFINNNNDLASFNSSTEGITLNLPSSSKKNNTCINNCNFFTIEEEIPLSSIIPCNIINCSHVTCLSSSATIKNNRSMSITLPGHINPVIISAPTTPSPGRPTAAQTLTSKELLAATNNSTETISTFINTVPEMIPTSSNSNSNSDCSFYTSPVKLDSGTVSICVSSASQDSKSKLNLSSIQKQLINSTELGKISSILGENLPCNTLYVGNLSSKASEDELRALFRNCLGYRRLSFRPKCKGPMCFVEFEDVACATAALETLYGTIISCSIPSKGGIRLSYSKNPLGLRVVSAQSNNNVVTIGNGSSKMNSSLIEAAVATATSSENTNPNHHKAIQTVFKHYFKLKQDNSQIHTRESEKNDVIDL